MITPIHVLMLQLGTPDAPTARALRRYLRQFLSDPRVIEMPAWKRWLVANLLVAPFRAHRSAEKYARIWDRQTGSPLLNLTRRQANALGDRLGERFCVHFGMGYGRPPIADAVGTLIRAQCSRLVVLPMFPQYSGATTASVLDGMFAALRRHRVMPAMRIIRDYHNDEGYIAAVTHGIEKVAAAAATPPDHCLLSFHGLPQSFVHDGDPYEEHVRATAAAIARKLKWPDEFWSLTYQSRFGAKEWLQPYTDRTLEHLGRSGRTNVLVATPGFTTDCLETLDEIGFEATVDFLAAGGRVLLRVPCVNDDPQFIDALANRIVVECEGWL